MKKEIDAKADEVAAEVMGDDNAQGDTTAVAVHTKPAASLAMGEVSGEITAEDIGMPKLAIAYGVGKLSEKFNPGDVILSDDSRLVGKGEPLNFVVVGLHQYWKEYLSNELYQSGARPRTFETEAEVWKAGGTTAWVGDDKPSFSKAMDLKLLVERPKDLICGLFGIELGGKVFAPAIWYLDKSGYKRVSKVVLGAASFSLKTRGITSGIFELKTANVKVNGNNIIVPEVRLVGHNTDEFLAEMRKLLAS